MKTRLTESSEFRASKKAVWFEGARGLWAVMVGHDNFDRTRSITAHIVGTPDRISLRVWLIDPRTDNNYDAVLFQGKVSSMREADEMVHKMCVNMFAWWMVSR